MPVILKAEGIEKQYGNEKTGVHALRGIDLEIEEGRFYAIIGKSGSGKSTLLHILGGLDKPTKGRSSWKGKIFPRFGAMPWRWYAVGGLGLYSSLTTS